MSTRFSYEVDPHNRLIIKKGKGASDVKRFRKIVKGRFKVDPKNRLYYEVFKSSKSDIPQKIKFSGKYSLDKKGNLIFTLDKWNNQYAGNRLRLKTGIIDANDNELVFILNSKVSKNKRTHYMMRVHGVWRADRNNRIGFDIENGVNKVDNLRFFNAWRLNDNNEIEYRYKGTESNIRLKGSWDVGTKNRLGYILNKEIGSGFDFRTSVGRITAKKTKIYAKFDIVIEVSKRKKIRRKILFLGVWRLKRGRKILLEVSPGRRKNLVLKLRKDILGKKGFIFMESFLKKKEAYIGGGAVLEW